MSGLGLGIDLNAKEWQAALAVFAPAVYRQASAQTLNAIAKQVDTAERENLRKSFTLRNKYTEGSLRLYTASEKKDIASQNAVVGSVSVCAAVVCSGLVINEMSNTPLSYITISTANTIITKASTAETMIYFLTFFISCFRLQSPCRFLLHRA